MRKMKDSGIEWIGEIPEEWNIVRVRYLFDISRGRVIATTELKDEGYPVFSSQTENNGCMGYVDTFDYEGEYLTWTTDGAKAGSVFYRNGKFNCTNVCGILKLRNTDIDFAKFLNYSVGYSAFHCRRADINGYKIMSNEMAAINIVRPSIQEQKAIASYLDHKCSEIDSIVRNTEKTIEEYKKLKQSLITEVVTGKKRVAADGVSLSDEPRKMKDSGVEWIGEVPEEWGMSRLKGLGNCQNGISKGAEYFGDDFEYPFVNYTDAYNNYEIPEPKGRANSTQDDRFRYSLKEGDVLFTRTSETIEEIGFASTCMNEIENAVFSGFLIRFRPTTDKLNKGFSKYYFRSSHLRRYFVKEMNLVTRASLSQQLLKGMPVLLPSIDEQKMIATYLDTKCSEIDKLIADKQTLLQELESYKKSLIYECVTGKREVK